MSAAEVDPTQHPDHARPAGTDDAESIRTLGDALRVFVSKPGPRTIAATAATFWGLRALAGPPGPLDVVAAGAAVAWWPFQEWILHKHVLHMKPREVLGIPIDPDFARKHRAHHADPRSVEKTLLPLPVIVGAMPFAAAGWAILLGALPGGRRAALTGMAAYSTMALAYEWTHLLVHTGHQPKSAFAKKVRRNHRLHHYRSEHHWYGFTVPQVDALLGTDPEPASVPRSPTAMNLHGIASPGDAG